MDYNEAADYFKNIHSIDAMTFYKTLSRNAGRAFTISWVNSIETLEDIRKEFEKQTRKSFDPKELKAFIQETVISRGDDPLKPSHLANVVRTNVQTAFSKGRIEAQIELGKDYWQYYAVVDGRETPLCHTLDGKIFKSSDPFWEKYYPPNHYQCRSTVVALDADEIDDPVDDGLEYLKKSDLKTKDREPGRGFQYSPKNSLDEHLNKKRKEHKIELKEKSKEKTPKFKTIAELEEFLSNKYPNTSFDFKGVDSRNFSIIGSSLDELLTKYRIDKLNYVGTYLGDKGSVYGLFVDWEEGEVAHCRRSTSGNKIMALNPNYFNDYKYLNDTIEQGILTNHSPKGIGKHRAKYIVYHEFGHILDYQFDLEMRNDKIIIDLFNSNEFISRYASYSIGEFIAEAFADYHLSKTPSPVSKKVWDRFKKIMKGKK